jgi:hypothetical protein
MGGDRHNPKSNIPLWPLALSLTLLAAQATPAKRKAEPSVMHGAGQVVGGLLFELPRTLLDATLTGPPVVGTAVGLLAGTARALQVTVSGLLEMSAGFDPWGAKKSHRRSRRR